MAFSENMMARLSAATMPVSRLLPAIRAGGANPRMALVLRRIILATPLALSVTLSVPAVAQTAYGQYYTASAGGAREGINAGGFHAPDMYGSLPVASILSGVDWSVNAVANDTNGGTVTANAQLAIPPLGQQTYISELYARSTLRYTFTIDGPDADALVPVLFNAAAFATVSEGGGYGFLELGFSHDGETLYRMSSVGTSLSDPAGFEVNELVYLHPGNTYSLELQAQASVYENSIAPGYSIASTSATVDPTFAIQGEFAQLYHFIGLPDSSIVSPGGPAAAVPEPASWAMMVGGFGLVGSAMRRRRTRFGCA